jgi:large subunit ribosomal protein L32
MLGRLSRRCVDFVRATRNVLAPNWAVGSERISRPSSRVARHPNMANPKRKLSRASKGHRRAHLALERAQLVRCTHCGAMIKPHTICKACGHYRGRHILAADNS